MGESSQIPTSTTLIGKHSIDYAGLQGFAWSEEVGKDFRIVQEAMNIPPGSKRGEWVRHVADKNGVSRPTVFRLIAKFKKGGLPALMRTKSTKGKSIAWTSEALGFWEGLYLYAPHRHISKKSLYKTLVVKAKEEGWKIGSYGNACKKLSENISPQLVALQRGGARELDNTLPPILRTYADLQPFEIIVGDQHRFDFWVLDPQTGEVFRPEGYLWQDLRTRAIYGLALGKKYNSHMIASALWIGVRQFGLFRNIYTDNGRPELSRYVDSIVDGVKGYGLAARETISTSTDLRNVHPEEVRCDITLSGQHRKAIVRNAKAKMIEGSFNVIEGGLRDQALLPGYVKKLTDPSERQEIDQNEVKRLAESGQLPTFEEFYQALIAVCDWYNFEKPHRGLLREAPHPKPKSITPMNCLEMCMREGWRPTWLPEEAIDLLFLPKEPNPRTVDRGRIRFRNDLYEHPNLIELNGQKVELRFDPQDLGYVLVFHKNEYLCRAETVEYSSMKNRALASRKIKEKAHHRKMVVKRYHEITKGIPDVRHFSEVPKLEKTAALIANDKRKKAIENETLYRERTKEELALEVADLKTVSQTIQHTPQTINEPAKRPVFFLNDETRYQWVLGQSVNGLEIPEEDQAFREAHERKMDPEILKYWQRRQEFKEVGLCQKTNLS